MQPNVNNLIVDGTGFAPAARCAVCGNDIAAGEGLTARYEGRLLRFKCPGCLSRFTADPERYLSGEPAGCCGAHEGHSPASEWIID